MTYYDVKEALSHLIDVKTDKYMEDRHRADYAHGDYPHINIRRKDGKKVLINITG